MRNRLFILAVVVFLGTSVLPAHADLFGTNLLANPDAELGTNSADGFTVVYVPGWQTNGDFTVVSYLAGDGFPGPTDPGPTNRGNSFFAGGPQNDWSGARQWIDVSSLSSQVDTSGVACVLSGYLGGFHDQYDHATFTAFFQGETSNTLGSVVIGPITPAERPFHRTGMHRCGATETLPIGTRAIEVVLDMMRFEGGYNDGYADNLSLVLIPGHGRPALGITNSMDSAVVSWLTNFTGYQLEITGDVAGITQWTSHPDPPVISGNLFVVTNAFTNTQQLFRLRK
jgi:hypothetical protein